MIVLAFDTALGACSAALVADGVVVGHEHRAMARGHAEALAPMVDSLMRASGWDFAALDLIGVTTGPGTFTGQRVGLAFARALRLALHKPAIGVTTLDCLAEEALSRQARPWAVAAADARRDEVYLGARSAKGETLIAPELIARDAVGARLAALADTYGHGLVLAGTAVETLLPSLAGIGLQCADSLVRQPDALLVAKLAAVQVRDRADMPMPPPPRPLYLRAPDAKLPGSAP